MYKSLETEVLVIGGGGAGCRAAIEAHDKGSKVLMMLKGRLGNSGCTLWVGISSAVGSWGGDKSDSTETSMIDLLSYGGYLGNQDLAKILSDESADRVHEMEEWCIDFRRNYSINEHTDTPVSLRNEYSMSFVLGLLKT